MTARKSSISGPSLSPGNIQRQSSLGDVSETVSNLSFKHWHKEMQARHESQGGRGFRIWKWCFKACKLCRWFDSIEYDRKLCKCCLKFKTLKVIGTFLLIAIFIYILMYSIWKEQVLPGGTIFFLFLLFTTAYITGFILLFIGFPPMLGHLLVGMLFSNLPRSWLPYYDPHFLEETGYLCEKIILIIATIRAGLLLDFSRIKGRVPFILRISLVPLICEQILSLIASHYLMNLPWDWSALQGSLLCIISLATLTSIMEKNRSHGYGEDKHMSTVLLAAAAANVVFGTFSYVMCLSLICPSKWQLRLNSSIWQMFVNVLEQIFLGVTIGTVCGFLIAFFPDKRNKEAATLRILIIGLGSFSIAFISYTYNLAAAGVLSVLAMCVIASNMWEELGWHDRNNPVQYFYTMAYYFGQPVALSLVGFSMNFQSSDKQQLGLAAAVIVIGLVGKEIACYLSTMGSLYPTTLKEKIFICIAWFSKGTFQALLAYAVEYTTEKNQSNMSEVVFSLNLKQARMVKKTTVLAILLTTPLSCFVLALSSSSLLTKAGGHPPNTHTITESNAENN